MDLRHLRYFVAVADAGTVSGAADRLRITQPALSRQIHDLEQQLGVRLFDRVGRRLDLTADGEDLLRRSRELLVHVEALTDRARALQVGDAGILRVGATSQTIETVLAPFLPRYRRAHPSVEVHLVEDGGFRLLPRLRAGELQVVVATPGPGLQYRPLFPGRVLALMMPCHPLARHGALEVKALAAEPLLLLREGFQTRQWFDGACQIAHVRPRVLIESSAPAALVALARAGHGIAVVPSNTRIDPSGVRAVPLLHGGQPLGGWVAACWDSRRLLPRYGHGFVDELAAFTRRSYPGKRFERHAPAVPRPSPEPSAPA
jgi:LysR family cyn operon transcriptional activator